MNGKKILYLVGAGTVALVLICVLLVGLVDGYWPWQNDKDMGGGYTGIFTEDDTTADTQNTTEGETTESTEGTSGTEDTKKPGGTDDSEKPGSTEDSKKPGSTEDSKKPGSTEDSKKPGNSGSNESEEEEETTDNSDLDVGFGMEEEGKPNVDYGVIDFDDLLPNLLPDKKDETTNASKPSGSNEGGGAGEQAGDVGVPF